MERIACLPAKFQIEAAFEGLASFSKKTSGFTMVSLIQTFLHISWDRYVTSELILRREQGSAGRVKISETEEVDRDNKRAAHV